MQPNTSSSKQPSQLNLLVRSVLFSLFQIASLFIFAPFVLLCFPFPYAVRYRVASTWAKLVIKGLKAICKLDYHVTGLENIKNNGIIFCKHQSAWETFALQVFFPQQCWVLKKALLWIPLFGWALYLTQPIAINRSKKMQAFKQIIQQGTERLRSGRWVVIFPEGTRTAPGEKKKYMIGGALLAEKSGFPVTPVAHNAGDFWRRNAFIKHPGTIQVRIGKPIDPTGISARELNQQAKNWIEDQVDDMSKKAP